jgi:hypothetical protein
MSLTAFAGALLLAGLAAWLGLRAEPPDPYAAIRPDLPVEVDGWRQAGPDREYDRQTIFGYIDGGGEVYRAYRMRRCLARRFERSGEPGLILDLFDMGSPADAYGVFTHDLEGEPAGLGEDSRYRPGWLTFWQGRFYVSVTAEGETDASAGAVRELGRRLAGIIPREPGRPEILAYLPPDGLLRDRTVYFHHPVILSAHLYLEDAGALHLDDRVEGALAQYRRPAPGGDPHEEMPARLVLLRYPTAAAAARARADFGLAYLEDQADAGLARTVDGSWVALGCAGRRLALVLDAPSPTLASALCNEALR